MTDLLQPVQDAMGAWWLPVWTLVKVVVISVPLILAVAYLTYAERKVIGWMQVRIGPNRVGPLGLLQPFADVLKMLFKEIVVPTGASRALFYLAEYMNMILIAALTSIMFLGGWLSPLPILNDADIFGLHPFGDGFVWFALKIAFVLLIFLWVRATFPRYRYDQLMRLGWKVFLPFSLGFLVLTAGVLVFFDLLPK